jgi:hypothetical protein
MKAWRIVQVVGVLVLTVGILLRIGEQDYGTRVAATGALVYALGWLGAWIGRKE